MRYINGNYIVSCSYRSRADFGVVKTALRIDEELCPDFPDSIDLKISNRCSWGCPFCHESSVPGGKIFDPQKTMSILSQLPPKIPIELAIGGGNVLDSIDEISPFIDWAKDYGFLVRCTINHKDLEDLTPKKNEFLKKFGGVGISIDKVPDEKFIQMVKVEIENKGYLRFLGKEEVDKINNQYIFPLGNPKAILEDENFVFHIIAGIFPPDQFQALVRTGVPVLVLGYKQWGRAKQNPLPDLTEIKKEIEKYISSMTKLGQIDAFERYENSILCFDNLAIDQLGIKDMVADECAWNRIFMGEEGRFSMYIDAVEGMYAKTSRSEERRSWDDVGLLEFFKDDTISV